MEKRSVKRQRTLGTRTLIALGIGLLGILAASPNARSDESEPAISKDVIPLRFDASKFSVFGIGRNQKDDVIVIANDRASGYVEFQNLNTGKIDVFGPDSSPPTTYDVQSKWTTWSWLSNQPQTLSTPDYSLTIVQNDFPNELYGDRTFYDSCLDPASTYLDITRGRKSAQKVILYKFAKPVTLVAQNRCEEDLYSDPHKRVEVIDPILVGQLNSDGSAILVGRSYASMPVAIRVTRDGQLKGDGKNIFILDKVAVDRARILAANDYQADLAKTPGRVRQSAELAVIIEDHLLALTKQMETAQ